MAAWRGLVSPSSQDLDSFSKVRDLSHLDKAVGQYQPAWQLDRLRESQRHGGRTKIQIS